MEYLHKLSESNEALKKVVIYAAEKQYEEPIKFQPKLEQSPRRLHSLYIFTKTELILVSELLSNNINRIYSSTYIGGIRHFYERGKKC